MNEIMTTIVVPVLLILLSAALAAIGWFLKGMRGEITALTARISASHETFATRPEFDRLAEKVDKLRVELHTEYVDKDTFLRSATQHQLTLERIRDELQTMSTNSAALKALVESHLAPERRKAGE